jgi:hypothetical protein
MEGCENSEDVSSLFRLWGREYDGQFLGDFWCRPAFAWSTESKVWPSMQICVSDFRISFSIVDGLSNLNCLMKVSRSE